MTMSEIEPSTLGATLKKRREELGLTLAEVAEKTRIRATFLKAMEEDRFDGFPGDAYLHGFLKLFAGALKLDVSMVMAQFYQQTGLPAGGRGERKSTVCDLPTETPRRKRKVFGTIPRVMVLGGLVLGAAIFLYLRPFSTELEVKESPQPSPVSGESSETAGSAAQVEVAETSAEDVQADAVAATSAEAAPAEPREIDYAIPSGGAMLRVEALGAVNVEVLIDDLPLKHYALGKDTVLSWRVLKSLQLQVDVPEQLKVWLENEPLDLRGRTTLSLQAAMSAAEEGTR